MAFQIATAREGIDLKIEATDDDCCIDRRWSPGAFKRRTTRFQLMRLLHQFHAKALELLGDGKIGAAPRQAGTSMRQVPKIISHFPHGPDLQ